MNRKDLINVFGNRLQAPNFRNARKLHTGNWTTGKSGYVIPLKFIHVLPGYTIKANLAYDLRLLTPAVPIMDDATVEFAAFNVPLRILAPAIVKDFSRTNDMETFFGEIKKGVWANQTETVLQKVPIYRVNAQSIANYCGVPVTQINNGAAKINLINIAAVCQIWNDHFRNPNVQPPIDLEELQRKNIDGILNNNEPENRIGNLGSSHSMELFPVCKYKDYFTTALREPQRTPAGQEVRIPIGSSAPVVTTDPSDLHSSPHSIAMVKAGSITPASSGTLTVNGGKLIDSNYTGSYGSENIVPGNLIADLTKAEPLTVNAIRRLFAIQQLQERSARSGSRYYEYLQAAYGTSPSDAVLQRSEMLGGFSSLITMNQVLATNGTTEQPLGSTGAFSNTSGISRNFIDKSFTEHGVVVVVGFVRTSQSYGQGLEAHMTYERQFDFYDPMFANLGEQAIKNQEIYVTNSTATNNGVFGYKEAWEEDRVEPNTATGLFSPGSPDVNIKKWTYTNNFTKLPTLSTGFLEQDPDTLGSTLIDMTSDTQFMLNTKLFGTIVSTVPNQSIPAMLGGI